VERAFFMLRLNPGFEEEYDRVHEEVWPSVLDAIRDCGIKTYSIFRDGTALYFYMEAEDFQESMEILSKDPEHMRWNQVHGHFFESKFSSASGDSGFLLFPEVFRFQAVLAGDID
jgi:L-rhamnose mutarotase